MENEQMIIPARHSVNLGDLIYSLWGLRAVARKHNAKIQLFQWLDRDAFYYEGAEHPTKTDGGKNVTMNKKMFDMVKPLIESLDFIHSFEIYDCQKVALDLDRCRRMNVNIPYGDIRRWVMYADPELQADISEQVIDIHESILKQKPSLNFETGNLVKGQIIANRTSRYRNEAIHYGFLQHQPLRVYFAGTMEEYAEFQSHVPKAVYLPIKNFLELAIYISSAKLFIGNQSFCFALAEAMKTPRVLEVCSYAPNVIPCGPNGYDFYTQDAAEWLVNELVK